MTSFGLNFFTFFWLFLFCFVTRWETPRFETICAILERQEELLQQQKALIQQQKELIAHLTKKNKMPNDKLFANSSNMLVIFHFLNTNVIL